MPVYKSKTPTKDGRCWFYKTNYTDAFGEIKQMVSKKFATKTEAKKEEAKFLSELDQVSGSHYDMTFQQLYDKFLEHKEQEVRITTKYNYSNKIKHLERFMNLKCREYNIELFEKWKKEMNEKPELGTTTKNDILKFWKSILNFGMDWYGLDFNLTYRKMSNFTNPNELKKEMDFYTYEEFQTFISNEDDLRLRCLWETLYYCGLRCGEARGLTWDCVDLVNRRLSVKKQVQDNKAGGGWYIGNPKTRDSYRTIPICESLANDLIKYKATVDHYRNFNDGFFVFGESKGVEPYDPRRIRKYSIKTANKAGLKHIRLHDFRHSCASLLINNGASITMVARYLGHTKIDITLNTYSHMFQSALDGVINIINELNNPTEEM